MQPGLRLAHRFTGQRFPWRTTASRPPAARGAGHGDA